MKKMLTAVLSLSLLGTAALPALAADAEPPMVISPGPELIAPTPEEEPAGFAVEIDGEPAGVRACVMVPLRAVAERLGFSVVWDNGVVTVTGQERYVQLTIGTDQYFAAPTQEGMMGASLFSLGCAPYVSNDTTYVPVELFDALLGCREGTVTLEGNTVKLNTAPNSMNAVQIPNPFADCATLAEAAQTAGFALTVPEQIGGSPRRDIQAICGAMIQVFYGGEENEVCIRKAPGSEDISGDYSVYSRTTAGEADGVKVTLKGDGDLVHLAIWTNGGYTYSVLARAGMRDADMTALVRSVR